MWIKPKLKWNLSLICIVAIYILTKEIISKIPFILQKRQFPNEQIPDISTHITNQCVYLGLVEIRLQETRKLDISFFLVKDEHKGGLQLILTQQIRYIPVSTSLLMTYCSKPATMLRHSLGGKWSTLYWINWMEAAFFPPYEQSVCVHLFIN